MVIIMMYHDWSRWERDMAAHDYGGDTELAAIARRHTRIRQVELRAAVAAVTVAVAFPAGYWIGLTL